MTEKLGRLVTGADNNNQEIVELQTSKEVYLLPDLQEIDE